MKQKKLILEITSEGALGINLINLSKSEALALMILAQGNMVKHLAIESGLKMEIASCQYSKDDDEKQPPKQTEGEGDGDE